MAEEHGFQSPEGPRFCANNCGFFGSPATKDLCSKCYTDLCVKEQKPKITLTSSSTKTSIQQADSAVQVAFQTATVVEAARSAVSEAVVVQPKRCSVCKKKVGLTGFKCRCGTTFCGTHRYPEQHSCTFDFKSMGREAIAKANPLVKADKLDKI